MAPQQQVLSFREPSAERLGARPFACDFHVHAPTDWEDLGNKNIEAYLAEDYLPRVYAAGREVIGVPQHTPNAAAGGAKLVRDLARNLRSEGHQNIPIVFPGYELTSSDQLQVILLADPDEQNLRDLDNEVRILLEVGTGRNWHESTLTLETLLEKVRNKLRDRLVSLVVATGHKGLFEDGNATTRNRELYKKALILADGMILAGSFSDSHARVQQVLKGELQDYGDQACAYVQSSDARTFSALQPSSLSYVKLGSFTIEGLRQALLNSTTFIANQPFSRSSLAITGVRIHKTVFFDDFSLELNPYLTAIVGGRGTGKSCLLEYIAHVCDYQRATGYDRPNQRILALRDEGSGDGTLLPTTLIQLHVKVGDKHYRFERTGTGSIAIYECADERCEGGVGVTNASASDLLNLRFFGQRELANIVRNPAFFTLDPSQRSGINLFSFLKSDQLTRISELERRASTTCDNIKKLSIDLAASARDLGQRPKLVSEQARLMEDLERLKKQASHPALQSHRDFLKIVSNRDSVFAALDGVAKAHESLETTVATMMDKLKHPFALTATGAEQSLETLRTAALKQTEAFKAKVSELGVAWRSETEGLQANTENTLIDEACEKHREEYAAAKKEMEAQQINLALLEPLQKRVMEIDARLAEFNQLDAQITEGRHKRNALAQELRDVRKAQGDIYVELAQQLTESTQNCVRMTVVRAGDVKVAVAEFHEQLKDKRRFRRDDAEELARMALEAARTSDAGVTPASLWTDLVNYLVLHHEFAQDGVLGRAASMSLPADLAWTGQVGRKLKELVTLFDDQQLGALLCQHVPDSAVIELRRHIDVDQYLPISQASVGQKATALFLILLAHTDGLLIIDQPEDDLDNAFITNDILPALQELKHQQQVIFATHNANMLVNAEAEKIVVLDTEPRDPPDATLPTIRGKIEHEGGIDQSNLRERVTNILEGGREAFLARERKYRFTDQ